MGDMADDFRAYREYDRAKVEKHLDNNIAFIEKWAYENNLRIKKMQDQIRIEGRIDVWPQRLKWHDLKTNKYGRCMNQRHFERFLVNTFKGDENAQK